MFEHIRRVNAQKVRKIRDNWYIIYPSTRPSKLFISLFWCSINCLYSAIHFHYHSCPKGALHLAPKTLRHQKMLNHLWKNLKVNFQKSFEQENTYQQKKFIQSIKNGDHGATATGIYSWGHCLVGNDRNLHESGMEAELSWRNCTWWT